MINCLLFVLLFLISYLIVKDINIRIQVDRFKKRNNTLVVAKENSFKKLFSKINFIKTKENYLFLQGYPLNLNAISYYSIKIIMLLIFSFAGLLNYNSYLAMIIWGLVGYYFLDLYISLNKKSRDNEICTDLLNVTDSICLQLSSYVQLKQSIWYFRSRHVLQYFKAIYKAWKYNRAFGKFIISFKSKIFGQA